MGIDHLLCSTLAMTQCGGNVDTHFWEGPSASLQVKLVSDVQLSPDNASTLFVVLEAEQGKYFSKIYRKNDEEDLILLIPSEYFPSHPRWSPDGRLIAFLSSREDTKDLYLMSADGGEPYLLAKGNRYGIQSFRFAPKSQVIAFIMADEVLQGSSNVSIVYKQDTVVNRLWLIDIEKSEEGSRSLTPNDYYVRSNGNDGSANDSFDWSPDEQTIVFAYQPASGIDHYHLDSSLGFLDMQTGKVIPLEKKGHFEAQPKFSPDGKWIAYLYSNDSIRYTCNRQVAIRSYNGDAFRTLSSTYNGGPLLEGPNLLGWSQDGNHLFFFEPKGTKYQLLKLPFDGSSAEVIDTSDWFFRLPILSQDRTKWGFVVESTSRAQEAYIADCDFFTLKQISYCNDLPAVSKTEVVRWNSSDGVEVEGLLTYPKDYKVGERYPLLLVIHGGPMYAVTEAFIGNTGEFPIAAFAEAGFFVLRPNPRGSTGYGSAFRNALVGDFGGIDFYDLMTGVDHVIHRGMVDENRLGVMGWSYGGYMTTRVITQTSRFKAAVTIAGSANLVSMDGTTDLHRLCVEYLGEFWKNESLYKERSPIYHLSHVTTPCLIVHGVADTSVSVSQGYELYHALTKQEKEVSFVLYPDVGHDFEIPEAQNDAMERILDWFKQRVLR
ncbi:MAG: S9 family peptidase [Chlamydiota bacterium]